MKRLRKVSENLLNKGEYRTMEMCYDGTLVMPSNYAVMSEDEMTYVEGGKKH